MKFMFKLFMALHVFIYRISNGKVWGKMRDFNVLILTTKGKKSGKMLSNPLGYFEHNGGYIIVASNAGQKTNPNWYHNIKNNPNDVTLQVKDKVMKVTPEIILGEPRRKLYDWIVSLSPSYADYEKQTTREIPLVFLKP